MGASGAVEGWAEWSVGALAALALASAVEYGFDKPTQDYLNSSQRTMSDLPGGYINLH
jgi:hypothetical protein